ncbi:MAG: NAD(P)H-dependent oxidoreductase subunit E [Elusimicrobia bacterium]|nr:NAD(P)H-dependent oxidoreductase subunit E [Elusimicrobiota bacterium]
MSVFTPEQEKVLAAWTREYPYPNMGLVEALRSVQDWNRMISPEAAARVGEIFNLPFNRVWGVATFFPTFTTKPTGKYRVGLCHGLSCFLAGSNKMKSCLEKTFGTKEKETTADGKYSWEAMECLGACEQGPALLVNDRLQGKATEASIAKLKDLK